MTLRNSKDIIEEIYSNEITLGHLIGDDCKNKITSLLRDELDGLLSGKYSDFSPSIQYLNRVLSDDIDADEHRKTLLTTIIVSMKLRECPSIIDQSSVIEKILALYRLYLEYKESEIDKEHQDPLFCEAGEEWVRPTRLPNGTWIRGHCRRIPVNRMKGYPKPVIYRR